MFITFDTIHERDGHTQTPHDAVMHNVQLNKVQLLIRDVV